MSAFKIEQGAQWAASHHRRFKEGETIDLFVDQLVFTHEATVISLKKGQGCVISYKTDKKSEVLDPGETRGTDKGELVAT